MKRRLCRERGENSAKFKRREQIFVSFSGCLVETVLGKCKNLLEYSEHTRLTTFSRIIQLLKFQHGGTVLPRISRQPDGQTDYRTVQRRTATIMELSFVHSPISPSLSIRFARRDLSTGDLSSPASPLFRFVNIFISPASSVSTKPRFHRDNRRKARHLPRISNSSPPAARGVISMINREASTIPREKITLVIYAIPLRHLKVAQKRVYL